jgi:hypothetical protein
MTLMISFRKKIKLNVLKVYQRMFNKSKNQKNQSIALIQFQMSKDSNKNKIKINSKSMITKCQ